MGLFRRSIAWAIGFTLLFLGIHAILTFPLIKAQLGSTVGRWPRLKVRHPTPRLVCSA